MGADALDIDAEGLPVLRRDADGPPAEGLDGAAVLEMEQAALQDLEATLMEEWASPEDEGAFADL
jgi:hypothetical protein